VSPQEFGLLLIAVITSSCGQLLLKIGALQLGEVTPGNAVSHILSIATTPALLGGLCAYGIGAIAYILALTRINLSIAAPSASLIYVFSVMAGYFFFQEPISIGRAVGMGLIVCGVILVTVR
jgi:drug/metabolite transporter (DMT)-like permease